MAAAIDMYKYNTSTHQIATGSDQELMKALKPFITSASSSSSSSRYHHSSPSSSITQDSYTPTPSYSSLATPPPPTTSTSTSSSFSQLPPLYSSPYAVAPAAPVMNGPVGLTHLGLAQVQRIQAQFLLQQQQRGLHAAFLGLRA
jgi:EREBP-like factor